jgi:membrane protein insertase Oxa1/YidC/SpoIIIJ
MQFMPVMYLIFAVQEIITAGLVVYWVTTNVITIFQQLFLTGWGSLLPKHVQERTGYFEKGLIGIQIDKEERLREAKEAIAAESVETDTQAVPEEVPQVTSDGRKPKRRSTVASNSEPSRRSRTSGTSGRRRKRRKKNASRS